MKDFLAQYCHRNDEKINKDMFDRRFDRPLVDYILDTCKNLEVIPAIKLESYEFITDQTKIRNVLNKRHVKDPKIKNNRTLERLAQRNKTLYDLLVLNFRVTAKGRDEVIQRKIRILKEVKKGYYIKGGKKVVLLNQIVDNSTYVKGNILNFKATQYGIKLATVPVKLKFTDGETLTCPAFRIDVLTKNINPLYYFLAEYGLEETIELFNLSDILCVVDSVIDEDNYMYLPINDKLYLEVHEKGLYVHEFVMQFVATLYDILHADKDKDSIKLQDAYSKDFWLDQLSEIYSKRRYKSKGKRVLISFEKSINPYIKRSLALKKYHRRNMFTIIRWEMVNYSELLKKDSNDLQYKRVRANETLAYFFEKSITENINSLLNTDNPPFEKYVKLLNGINDNTLIKATQGSGKSSPSSMFRYERYNDFDAIDLARYTLKGPTGLSGGKNKTSIRYRDIYTSHYGRLDIDVCSSSDPGLTGYLTANVMLDEKGYFDSTNNEPDVYDPIIDTLIEAVNTNPEYARSRQGYIKLQLTRDGEGFMRLARKMTVAEIDTMLANDPMKYGLYRKTDGLHLMPKLSGRADTGFIKLVRRSAVARDEDSYRDEDGFIRLKRASTKLSRQRLDDD